MSLNADLKNKNIKSNISFFYSIINSNKYFKIAIEEGDFDLYAERLKEENYLNEERFAKAFISGHLRKKWGKEKIKAALLQKGITSATIKKYLDDVEETGYKEQLLELAEKKLRSIKAETRNEKKLKLLRFLVGRGYSVAECTAVIKKLLT